MALSKVALIGLGNNAANYYFGLMRSATLKLVAVCDQSESSASRDLFSNIPFYRDFRDLTHLQDLSLVIIVTPPKTHFEIARFFLSKKINVLVEKPPVFEVKEWSSLRGLANRNSSKLATAFHWQFGSEIIFLKSILPQMGIFIEAHTTIFDPYCTGSKINNEKVALGGSWMDSGSNALSVFNFLFPSLNPTLVHKEMKRDRETNLPYFADVVFSNNQNASFRITTDWRGNRDQKDSIYHFSKGTVTINHTAQTLTVNGKVHRFDELPRLSNHYFNLLKEFSFSDFIKHRMNRQTMAFLYEVNKQ